MKKKTNDNPFVSRNRRRTAYLSLVVCLAILVTAGVAGAFHLTGIAKTYHAVLTCTAEPKHGPGYADFFVHTHNEDCYDENGNLWCTLPEIEAHEHDASCYTTTLELICTTPESEGHHHTADCHTRVRGDLTCELSTEPVYDEDGNLVAEGHVHTDACYTWSEKLTCGKTEGEGAHHHDDACYQSVTKLTCKKPVVVLHTHDEDCYTEDEDGNLHLTCGMLEVTEHIHGEECFTVYEQDDDEPEETGNEVPADGATTDETPEEGEDGFVFLFPEEEENENETGDDIVTDEATTDEVTTDEVTTDEVTTDEATTDEATTDEVTTDEVTTDEVTTDTTEEKQEEPAPEPETPPQIRSLGGERRGATVLAEIPDGVLNEYAKLELADYDANLAKATILQKVNENAAEGEARDISAIYVIDIGFTAGGEAAFPNGEAPISITLRANEIRSMTAPKLYHLYSGTAEQVEDAAFDTAAGTVTFTSYGFSPFAVVELTGEDPAGIDMPAQNFHEWTDEVDVYVEADEGAFPAGTTMRVTAVPQEEVIDALNEAAPNAMVRNVQAVDITFYDAEGNEIEPATAIRVKMSKKTETPAPAAPAESTESVVMHVDNAGSAQIVENATVDNSTAEFESDSFSKYIFADLITEEVLDSLGNTYTISVTYGPEAKIPENSGLEVSEILETSAEYQEYIAKTESALGMQEGTAGYIRLFDIKIEKDGEKIQPADGTTVDVKIELKDAQADSLSVVHFADESDTGSVVQSTETEGQTVSFAADGFSVYAVVDENISVDESRMTLNFYNGSTLLATVYVKNGDDTDAELEQIIYDPGAGVLNSGELFKGWSLDEADYTTADAENSKSVEDIRAWAKEKANADSIVEGEVHNFYAMIYKTFAVAFKDEDGVTIHSEALIFKANEGSTDYTINQPYTPKLQDEAFRGWYWTNADSSVANAVTAKNGSEAPFENGTEVTIKDNVTFTVNVPKGYWLSFAENGRGASYTPPQFITSEGNTGTEKPADPTRQGYQFKGWNTKADGSGDSWLTVTYRNGIPSYSNNHFGGKLNGRTTLYAQWEAVTTAPYTVVIWQQKANEDGYDFKESIQITDTVDKAINDSVISKRGTNTTDVRDDYARINGTEYKYGGFHFDRYDTGKTIAPEGTTVVNVYYDRNEYTFTFRDTTYVYTQSNSNSEDFYWIPDGNGGYEEVYLYRNNGNWYRTRTWISTGFMRGYYSYSDQYTGNRYKRSSSEGTIHTITKRYGAAISDIWSFTGNNGVTYPQTDPVTSWQPSGSNTYTARITTMQVMPAEDITFTHTTTNYDNRYFYYYVEALEGATNTRTFQGKEYSLYLYLPNDFRIVYYNDDFFELDGFERDVIADSNNNHVRIEVSGSDWPGVNNNFPDISLSSGATQNTLFFYYNRLKYPITYWDGKYFNGNGVAMDETNRGLLHTSDEIYFGANLGDQANTYTPDFTGYVFAGWYLDDACSGEPFDFANSTMPKGGIKLYAKWIQKQYRVFMHPNVPTSDTSLDWGGQEMCFRVDYGEKIAGGNDVKGTRDDYELIGWYTDEACTKPFNFDAYVLNDTTVTQAYNKTENTELDKYGNPTETGNKDDANNRFWIKKKLDLYAKWRSKIEGAPGINVQYDAVEGQGAFADEQTLHTDPLIYYLDRAEATGQAASIPTDSTKQFMYWVVQTWDTAQNKYVDTNEHVYPGDTFEVQKANARVEDITSTSTTPGVDKKYTVQLRAEYKDKDAPTPTHIWWFPNDVSVGTTHEATTADDDLKINEAVTIPNPPVREGYKFLGWARVNNTTSESSRLGEGTGMPTGKGLSLSADDLFFTYHEPANGNEGYYTAFINGTDKRVTKAAADEADPYHDMYAVWQSNTIKITKEIVSHSVDMRDINHTFYFALTKGDKTTFVRDDQGNIIVKEVRVVNGIPTPETVAFYELEDGDYQIWELDNPDGTLLSVGKLIERTTGTGNIMLSKIEGDNNASVSNASVVEKTMRNHYTDETHPLAFEANKKWMDRHAEEITAPEGAEVIFGLYKEVGGQTTAVTTKNEEGKEIPVTITLDGTIDTNGETAAWHAKFDNLPNIDEEGRSITYKVKELAAFPAGFYPWLSKDVNGEGMGYYQYMETSNGTIWNRQLTMTVRLDKHFDFQPNWGHGDASYEVFENDQVTRKKLNFEFISPIGVITNYNLCDDFNDYLGNTTYSEPIENIPVGPAYDIRGLKEEDIEEYYKFKGTIRLAETGQESLLEAYNYYLDQLVYEGALVEDGYAIKDVERDESDRDQLVEIRIQNKYRKITNECKAEKIVEGLAQSDWEVQRQKNTFRTLHYAIQNSKGQYYAGISDEAIQDTETGAYGLVKWSSGPNDAVYFENNFNNYNGGSGNWTSEEVTLQNAPVLPVGTYTIIEKEAAEGTINIPGYDLTVKNNTLTVSRTPGKNEYTGYNYKLSVTNHYEKKPEKLVSFKKVDIAHPDTVLPGAVFDLYKGTGEDKTLVRAGLYSNDQGYLAYKKDNEEIIVYELEYGAYQLIETDAPQGYTLWPDPITVTVGESGVTYDQAAVALAQTEGASFDETTNVYTIKIANNPGVELPSTGGRGTALFTAIGAILSGTAGAILTLGKRKA